MFYRPPGAGGRPGTVKLHDEPKAKEDEKPLSKAALKNKKKREAKQRAAKAAASGGVPERPKTEEQKAAVAMTKAHFGQPAKPVLAQPSSSTTDLEKRIRNMKKKLRAIDDLKAKQAAGEFLQANQAEKVAGEKGVRDEIERLEEQLASLLA